MNEDRERLRKLVSILAWQRWALDQIQNGRDPFAASSARQVRDAERERNRARERRRKKRAEMSEDEREREREYDRRLYRRKNGE